MYMITSCEACSGKVSLEAAVCPHCGHPGPKVIRAQAEREREQKLERDLEEWKRNPERDLREWMQEQERGRNR